MWKEQNIMVKRKLLKFACITGDIIPLSKFMLYVMQYFKDWCFLVNLYIMMLKTIGLENINTLILLQ